MKGYWFFVDPYVFVSVTSDNALLYNTLDNMSIESDQEEVIELLKEVVLVENSGVVLLSEERYQNANIKKFVSELRFKYMGDIIDSSLSEGKPIQVLPYYNYPNKIDIYKRHNFSSRKNVLKNLSEVRAFLGDDVDMDELILFLQSLPDNLVYNISGIVSDKSTYIKLLSYLNQLNCLKILSLKYDEVFDFSDFVANNFIVKVLIKTAINIRDLNKIKQKYSILSSLEVEYIFDVSSDDEYYQAEQIIERLKLEKYSFNTIYTGDNIDFFKRNVFLSKEDILSTRITIKDIFSRQAINVYDFGKINIMSNGDVYANLNDAVIGNIYVDNVYEIVQKEVNEGGSWFKIRDQYPCTNCIYQWLCPSPSIYERLLNCPNLCHVKE